MWPSFLLISCDVNKNFEVAEKLNKINEVEQAIPVYGLYDCLVKTKNLTSENIMNLVSQYIRELKHVHSVVALYDTSPNLLRAHVRW